MIERLIFSGSGGQGLMTAGKLLAACAVSEGKYVTYFPSYGSEVRGGTANCQMVLSDSAVLSPVVEEATVLLLMNQASLQRFASSLAEDGLIVLNSSMIESKSLPTGEARDAWPRMGARVLAIPATEIATKIGAVQVANVVMLAALNHAKNLVEFKTLRDQIRKALSGRRAALIPANEQALDAGRDAAAGWRAK